MKTAKIVYIALIALILIPFDKMGPAAGECAYCLAVRSYFCIYFSQSLPEVQ